MFEQDFANQIKMTGKPGEELMKPAISCNIIDMEDSSVEVEYFIQSPILLFLCFKLGSIYHLDLRLTIKKSFRILKYSQ